MRIFAFLAEPASYTIDRNRAVYEKLGVEYCYLQGQSEAKSTVENNEAVYLDRMSKGAIFSYVKKILSTYDAVIFNGYDSWIFVLLWTLNLYYRKPIGIDSDTPYKQPADRMRRWTKRCYLKTIFGNKRVYGLAGGNYVHKELFRKFGMPERRIFLMPMVVDNRKFDDPRYAEKSLQPFRFLYVGRLIACKNIEFLLKAFASYSAENPDAELHIVGTGVLAENLRKQYANHPAIHFDGPRYGDELVRSYHTSHVLILPSVYEPWGLVVNEAMSAGLPVLASDVVGARYDLIDNRETGFLFDPQNETSLVECMRRISDPARYRKYAQHSYQLLHGCWNYDLYKTSLENFLNTALNDSKTL